MTQIVLAILIVLSTAPVGVTAHAAEPTPSRATDTAPRDIDTSGMKRAEIAVLVDEHFGIELPSWLVMNAVSQCGYLVQVSIYGPDFALVNITPADMLADKRLHAFVMAWRRITGWTGEFTNTVLPATNQRCRAMDAQRNRYRS